MSEFYGHFVGYILGRRPNERRRPPSSARLAGAWLEPSVLLFAVQDLLTGIPNLNTRYRLATGSQISDPNIYSRRPPGAYYIYDFPTTFEVVSDFNCYVEEHWDRNVNFWGPRTGM